MSLDPKNQKSSETFFNFLFYFTLFLLFLFFSSIFFIGLSTALEKYLQYLS